MKNHKKSFITSIIMGSLICVTLIAAILTKMSYRDNLDQRPYIENPDYTIARSSTMIEIGYYADEDIHSLEELENYSDVIMRVCIDENDERFSYQEYTISKASVIEVYKGDISAEYVYIIEPISYFEQANYIKAEGGYNWMRDNDEYIVFATELRNQHIGKSDKIYLPVSCEKSVYNMSREIQYYHGAQKILKQIQEKY